MEDSLPEPTCDIGYTSEQIDQIVAEHGRTREEFNKWMRGQTYALCDGRRYNYELKQYEPTHAAHGPVYYRGDVLRFVKRLPVID